jgi:uncharacterized protein YxjI
MVPMQSSALQIGRFGHNRYSIQRPFFSLLGRTFRVYDPNGRQVLFVRHKVLSLKERWTIYADDSMTTPLVTVGARQFLGIDITTDVTDATTNEPLGAVRTKGFKSIIRDTWEVLGPGDAVIGGFQEDSNSLLRRFFPLLLGKWHLEVGGREVARITQVFRWFTKEFTLEVVDPSSRAPGTDPRFIVACALLALIREIARESR